MKIPVTPTLNINHITVVNTCSSKIHSENEAGSVKYFFLFDGNKFYIACLTFIVKLPKTWKGTLPCTRQLFKLNLSQTMAVIRLQTYPGCPKMTSGGPKFTL